MNADIKKYQVDSSGVPKLTSVDTRIVGETISTKSATSRRREDVTNAVRLMTAVFSTTFFLHSYSLSFPTLIPLSLLWSLYVLQYKHPEGSRMERRALYHGYDDLLKQSHGVTFTVPEKKFSFGDDVTLGVEMTNKAKQHVVRGTILCEAVDYTGKVLSVELVQ